MAAGEASDAVIAARVAAHIATCAQCADAVESARYAREVGGVLHAEVAFRGPPPALNPQSPPGYEIVREISRGGQGVVYEAVQAGTRRRVALKILRPELRDSTRQVARFEREIEIAAALDHPSIVRVFDSMRLSDGRHAIVMELVDGLTLDRWGRKRAGANGPRAAETAALMAEVCEAVHYAHQRGVIHRDLKPSNILVDPAGRPRVLDFGVSTWFGGAGGLEQRVTMTGEFSGTLAYAAPEQVSGAAAAADLRSDVYSLGVLLYESCMGRLPYSVEGSLETILRNISTCTPAPPGSRVISTDLWVIINQALAKEPERRYQSAAALGADLRRLLSGEAIEARRTSSWYTLRKTVARHRYAAAIAAVVVVSLISIGVVLGVSNRRMAATLRGSTVERARAIAAIGNRDGAEALLLPEILATVPPADAYLPIAFLGTPDQRRALWAYFEIQAPRPCLASTRIPVPAASTSLTQHADDGRVIVATSAGQIVDLSGTDLSVLRSVALSDPGPASLMTVSRSGDRLMRVRGENAEWFDCRTGQLMYSTPLAPMVPRQLRMTHDGSACAILFDDGSLRFLTPGAPAGGASALRESRPPVRAGGICLNPTGNLVSVHCDDGVIRTFDCQSGELAGVIEFEGVARDALDWGGVGHQSVAISPRGDLIGAGVGRELEIRAASGRLPVLFQTAVGAGLVGTSFAPSGRWLVTWGWRGSLIHVWETATWKELSPIPAYGLATLPMFSADERRFTTHHGNHTVRLWLGPADTWRHPLPNSDVKPHDLWISRDGSDLQAAASDGSVSRWDLSAGTPPVSQRYDATGAYSVDRGAGRVYAGGFEGVIRATALDPGLEPLERSLGSQVNNIRLNPAGTLLAACTQDSRVFVLEAATLRVVAQRDLGNRRLNLIRWSPDGRHLAVSARTGVVLVLDPSDLSSRATLPVSSRDFARFAAFSNDGKLLATGGDDPMVRFWEVGTWKLVGECPVGTGSILTAAFHADDRVLAVGERDGRVSIIGVPERRLLASFETPSPIMHLEFLPDRKRLCVASLGGPIEIWDFEVLARCVKGNRKLWEADASQSR